METLNTMLSLDREKIRMLRDRADIQIIQERSRGTERYSIKLNNGITVGGIQNDQGGYKLVLFDNYLNRTRFTDRTNTAIERLREVAEGVSSGRIREFAQEILKFQVTPPLREKRVRGRSLRMFQPIKNEKGEITGEYLELINRQINGRTIIGYRKVNLIKGTISGRWKYEMINPCFPRNYSQPLMAA